MYCDYHFKKFLTTNRSEETNRDTVSVRKSLQQITCCIHKSKGNENL